MGVGARAPIDAPVMDIPTPDRGRARAFPTLLTLAVVLVVTTAWTGPTPPSQLADAARAILPGPALADRTLTLHAAAERADADGGLVGFSSVAGFAEKAAERTAAPTTPIAGPARPSPANVAQQKPVAVPSSAPAASRFTGSDRFWIPSLGMSYRVHLFECSRNRPPDNFIYRWGCAGRNNVYILGHAATVMRPLHDLYVSGGLRKGMMAVYADGAGRIHKFRVTTWRVVDPVESAWAIADQPVSSMTLQTCVGPQGRLRLNVRLVEVR